MNTQHAKRLDRLAARDTYGLGSKLCIVYAAVWAVIFVILGVTIL